MISMRFLYIIACVKHPFLFITELAITLSYNIFNHPLDGCLASLLFLFIIYQMTMNILVQVFGRHIFSVFVGKYIGRIAGSQSRQVYA